jgi:hypothetical protein
MLEKISKGSKLYKLCFYPLLVLCAKVVGPLTLLQFFNGFEISMSSVTVRFNTRIEVYFCGIFCSHKNISTFCQL